MGDKNVHSFAKSVSPKVNIIALLEFELAYYDVASQALQPISHGVSPLFLDELLSIINDFD